MGVGASRTTYAHDPNFPMQLPTQFQQYSSVQSLRTEDQVREAVTFLKELLHQQTEYTKCIRRQAENKEKDGWLDARMGPGRVRKGHGDRGHHGERCSGRSFREGQNQVWREVDRELLKDLKRQIEEQGRFLRDQSGRARFLGKHDDGDDLKSERDRDAARLRERDRERERDRDKDRDKERDRDRDRERLRWEQTYFDSRYRPHQSRDPPFRDFEHPMAEPPQPRPRYGPRPTLPMMMPDMAGHAPRPYANGLGQDMYYDDFGMRGQGRRRRRPPFVFSPDVRQMKCDSSLAGQPQPGLTQHRDDASYERFRPGGLGPRGKARRGRPKVNGPAIFGAAGGGGGEGGGGGGGGGDIVEDFFAEHVGTGDPDAGGNHVVTRPVFGHRLTRRRDFKRFGGQSGSKGMNGGDQGVAAGDLHGQFQRRQDSGEEPAIEELDENDDEDNHFAANHGGASA